MRVDFDPIAFHIFGFGVHWYGLMYMIGFVAGWWLGRVRAKKPNSGWKVEEVDDLLFYVGLGIILGGRIGYILFYDMMYIVDEPTVWDAVVRVFAIWKGGMSFHGGLLGVLVALWLFQRKYKKGYFNIVDFVAPLVPIGLGAGRIGNFINGELWGKPTDLPWAMIFPRADPPVPRHPNPLYEAFLEGLVLFIILWWFSSKPRPTMAVSGLFALCYGIFRFAIEFVRVPDPQLGYLAFGWVTMGQILSLPLILGGIALMWFAYHPLGSRSK
jgi:phosphatidylglycerol:prolipoprotein diacylglycerol transferase